MKIRLIGALVSVAFLILVVFSIPLASFVATVERERLVTALERDAFMLAGHAKETLNTTAGAVLPSLQPFIEEYAIASRARIVVTNYSIHFDNISKNVKKFQFFIYLQNFAKK